MITQSTIRLMQASIMWYLLAVRILRKLKKVIGELIAYVCRFHNVNVDYVFKGINDIPGELPVRRTKQGIVYAALTQRKFSI